MTIDPNKIIHRLIAKARQSLCNYRVAAIALDKKGRFIDIKCNKPRNFLSNNYRNSYHAELLIIYHNKPSQIKEIIIGRIGKGNALLPIDPCDKCERLAGKYNIVIRSIS